MRRRRKPTDLLPSVCHCPISGTSDQKLSTTLIYSFKRLCSIFYSKLKFSGGKKKKVPTMQFNKSESLNAFSHLCRHDANILKNILFLLFWKQEEAHCVTRAHRLA
jgi:hypothetical protein